MRWGISVKKLIFAASFLAASAVTASAADLAARPYTKATPIAAAAYDWSGFYVGATAGGAWSKDAVSLNTVNGEPPLYDTSDIPSLNALGSSQLNQSHGIFGGRIGYNYQVSSLVVGLEGDLSSFRFNRSASATGIPFNPGGAPFGNAAFNQNASTSWLATVRGRSATQPTGYCSMEPPERRSRMSNFPTAISAFRSTAPATKPKQAHLRRPKQAGLPALASNMR
jgi:outer membrane immunogenic protein